MADGGDRRIGFEELTGLSIGRALLITLPCTALIAGSIWLAVQFLDPMPPRRIVLAAGPHGSELHALAERYAARVSAQGIGVDVLATRGTGDNIALLAERPARVDAGFVVAGSATADQAATVVDIANLYLSPLWGFVRAESADVTLASLRGRRIAVGAPGSGLNAMLVPVLAANGVTAGNTDLRQTTRAEALQSLAAGNLDAVFLGEGPTSPDFQRELSLPGVQLMSFPRAEAYERRFPYIVQLSLPTGTIDLERGIPDRPLKLIGSTMMLVARADIHPTVVDLLVDSAQALQSHQGLFHRRGDFPQQHAVDNVPISGQAVLYAREGPSLLRRYLPLWAADAMQRALILAVPLVAVIIPLMRFLPAIIDLIGRRQLLMGYARLRRVEQALRARGASAPVGDLVRELERIEESVATLQKSVIRAGAFYTFRVHLRLVRESVATRRPASSEAAKLPS